MTLDKYLDEVEQKAKDYLESETSKAQHVSELWALPIGAKSVINFSGEKLYSSPKLKYKYLKAMGKTARTKPYISSLEKLISRKKVIPCWMSKGLFGFTFYKIFAPAGTKSIMGFYSPKDDMIAILMDNNTTFGFASNNWLSKLTTHELLHLSASKLKGNYLTIFKDELTIYYSKLFEGIFKTKNLPDKVTQKIYTWVFNNFELKDTGLKSFTLKYYDMLDENLSEYTKLDKDMFEQTLLDYITVARYLENIDGYIYGGMQRYRHIIAPMYKAYKSITGTSRLSTLCIQELVYPSEVICCWSEYAKNISKAHSTIKKVENK